MFASTVACNVMSTKISCAGHLYHFRALTEKIVGVLPKMKCPHRIEPHQIQGLDFIHIYPVVQVSEMQNNILGKFCLGLTVS